jgi:hypothetical protein
MIGGTAPLRAELSPRSAKREMRRRFCCSSAQAEQVPPWA